VSALDILIRGPEALGVPHHHQDRRQRCGRGQSSGGALWSDAEGGRGRRSAWVAGPARVSDQGAGGRAADLRREQRGSYGPI